MEKFLLISIIISAVLTPLITAKEISCKSNETGPLICGNSSLSKYPNQSWGNPALDLDLTGFSSIAPNAFQNITIYYLQLGYPILETCEPKVFDFAPESFTGLSKLETLNLVCINFTAKPDLFKNLTSVKYLGLTAVEILGNSHEFFDFPNLDTVKLSNVNLTAILPSIIPKNDRRLRILYISGERTIMEPKPFKGLHNLNSLVMSLEQLIDLKPDLFDGLAKLEYLRIHDTKITSLRANVFEKLSNLERLNLGDNRISRIDPEAFLGLSRLLVLFLNNNRLKDLPAGVFNSLKNLELLYLNNNTLESVPPGVCQNLKNLKVLCLNNNEIRNVRLDAFEGCLKLTELVLSHNRIVRIEASAFRGLQVGLLGLQFNQINVLEQDTFSGLHIENALALYGNNITVIEPQAFRNMKHVTDNQEVEIFLSCYGISEVDRDNWGFDDSIDKIYITAYEG